jgi:hypothetical protein
VDVRQFSNNLVMSILQSENPLELFLQTILKALVFGCHMSNTLLSDIRRRLNLILLKVLGENLVDSTFNGVSLRGRTL